MSPSDAPLSTYPLKIRVEPPTGGHPEDVRVTIYDGQDNLRHQGYGNTTLDLPVGLYTARWEYAGELDEKIFRFSGQKHLDLDIKYLTPAPVPGSTDFHEYYSGIYYTSNLHTKTGSPLGNIGANAESHLHLLIRAQNLESYRGEDLAADLRLLDQHLQPICNLRERSKLDKKHGSLHCSLPAEPGFYFIEYRPETEDRFHTPRLFPLQLIKNWQTSLCVYHIDGHPLLESASMMIDSISHSFEKREVINTTTDAALAALQGNLDRLPQEIERLLNDKFENPLLGLLGAHLLLRHFDPKRTGPRHTNFNEGLPELVLRNLAWLLPDSPDVDALSFKAAGLFPDDRRFPRPAPVRYPPLLRASVEAILEADTETVTAIDDGGLLAALASNLYTDSPWATFRPPNRSSSETKDRTLAEESFSIEEEPMAKQLEESFFIEEPIMAKQLEPWLVETVKDISLHTTRTGYNPDWAQLATSLGVSYRRIMGVVDWVNQNQGDASSHK